MDSTTQTIRETDSRSRPPSTARPDEAPKNRARATELLVQLAELGVSSCTLGAHISYRPLVRVPPRLTQELASRRHEVCGAIGLDLVVSPPADRAPATPLSASLRRWPHRERYAVADLERQGLTRSEAVARIRCAHQAD